MCIKKTKKQTNICKTHERALKGRIPAVSEQIVKIFAETEIDIKVDPNFSNYIVYMGSLTQRSQFHYEMLDLVKAVMCYQR